MTPADPAPEQPPPLMQPLIQSTSGGVSYGAYNRIEHIGDLIAGDKITLFVYTGPAQPPDDAARQALERAYRSEIAARYAVWRSRYVALSIQPKRQPTIPGTPARFEREELVFTTLRRMVAASASADERTPELVDTDTAPFTDLGAGLARFGDLLLLGPPGGGKTTALWRLALDLAETGLAGDLTAPLPVFVRLGALVSGQALDALLLEALAKASLPDAAGRHFPLLAHHTLAPLLEGLLASGRLVLLWDGLNEVPQATFSDAARALDAFRRQHPGPLNGPGIQNVITCRADDYAQLLEQCAGHDPLPITQATIQGLNQAAINQLVLARLGTDTGAALLAALAQPQQHALAELARTPLLLTMLCEVYAETGVLPTNRGRLLEAFVTQRWVWEQERHDQSTWIKVDVQKQALAALAYAITASRGRGTGVAWEWAQQQIRASVSQADPARILQLGRQADLLELLDDGQILRFSHQLIQEYFAAVALRAKLMSAARWREGWLTSWYGSWQLRQYAKPGRRTGWEETLLLLAGLGEGAELARELVRTFLSQPLRAAQLLLAGGATPDPALHDEVRQALLELITSVQSPASERVEAGHLLGLLGDPRPGVCTLEPDMQPIAGGVFVIGMTPDELKQLPSDEQDWLSNARNTQPLTVPSFAIARYPVTNWQYQQFVDAGAYNPDAPWWSAQGTAWLRQAERHYPSQWNDERFGPTRPNHPVVGITWFEAIAFCDWLTAYLNDDLVYSLPSEAEWEYAARGVERRMYPWGDKPPDNERANYKNRYGGTTAVGCFPAGATPEGVLDMAGNVWEWTRSEFRPYPYDPSDGPEAVDATMDKGFTLRGGSWYNRSFDLRAARRLTGRPGDLYYGVGFRLARHPKSVKH